MHFHKKDFGLKRLRSTVRKMGIYLEREIVEKIRFEGPYLELALLILESGASNWEKKKFLSNSF